MIISQYQGQFTGDLTFRLVKYDVVNNLYLLFMNGNQKNVLKKYELAEAHNAKIIKGKLWFIS